MDVDLDLDLDLELLASYASSQLDASLGNLELKRDDRHLNGVAWRRGNAC